MQETGYEYLKGWFPPDDIAAFEEDVFALYAQQALKLGDHRRQIEKYLNSEMATKSKFSYLLEELEETDKEALYQVQKFMPSSQRLRALLDDAFMDKCAELLGSKPELTLLDGPALFINRKFTDRLLYKWHSEAHYYPKRRRFLNVWLPIFGRKTKENGAMSFKVGSHKRDFPFAEYTGFNKNSENKRNHFVQYEIPENFLTEYEEHVCECDPGDVYIFDRALVHRSNKNVSDKYSFAVVARVWSPEDDLTISGNLAATPYGGDIGRADLIVSNAL